MKHRKRSRIAIGLLLIFAVFGGLTLINHPIILKWLSGSARLIGRPIESTVYTDGKINKDIKVYHVKTYWNGDPADYYILQFPYADNSRLKILSLNKQDNFAGSASSTNVRDYDNVGGLLFQSEVGARFTPLEDDIKGFDFDPNLTFKNKEITLSIPPNEKELGCDSLRIVL